MKSGAVILMGAGAFLLYQYQKSKNISASVLSAVPTTAASVNTDALTALIQSLLAAIPTTPTPVTTPLLPGGGLSSGAPLLPIYTMPVKDPPLIDGHDYYADWYAHAGGSFIGQGLNGNNYPGDNFIMTWLEQHLLA